MRKTKKLLALAIAVVMTVSLFSFLGLNSSAAPPNLALNTEMNAAGDNPASFPRPIAPILYHSVVAFYRLLNGNTDIYANNQRITWGTNPGQLDAFQAAYREMQGDPEADWFATNDRPGLWVGVDFGTPQSFNQVVIYQTALPDERGILGTFVIEVANYDDLTPYWVPDSFLNEDGTLQNPNRTAPLGSFNQNGWTVASDVITANTTADGFTGGPITVDLTHTGEYRYVRIRTIANIMPPDSPNNQGLPMITSLQVFQQPDNGYQPDTDVNDEGETQQPAFVAATDIPSTPSEFVAGAAAIQLPTQATPANATYSAIVWTVTTAGTTGASIDAQGRFTATAAGTVTLTATVANGTAVGTPLTITRDITVTPPTSSENDDVNDDVNENGGESEFPLIPVIAGVAVLLIIVVVAVVVMGKKKNAGETE